MPSSHRTCVVVTLLHCHQFKQDLLGWMHKHLTAAFVTWRSRPKSARRTMTTIARNRISPPLPCLDRFDPLGSGRVPKAEQTTRAHSSPGTSAPAPVPVRAGSPPIVSLLLNQRSWRIARELSHTRYDSRSRVAIDTPTWVFKVQGLVLPLAEDCSGNYHSSCCHA